MKLKELIEDLKLLQEEVGDVEVFMEEDTIIDGVVVSDGRVIIY